MKTEKVVALATKESRMKRVCAVARQMDVPWSRMFKIVRKWLQILPIQNQTCSIISTQRSFRKKIIRFAIPFTVGNGRTLALEHFVDC